MKLSTKTQIELSSFPFSTIGEIAKNLLLDKSTGSRLISKAMKKGYIKLSFDRNDKRKRFLHLTELRIKTLEAFEPIAFNQTKQALLTLLPVERDLVYQGIYLYAQGLKRSRLQNQAPLSKENDDSENVENTSDKLSKSNLSISLCKQEDENALYEIFRKVVDSGNEFPYKSNSIEEFYHQFFSPESKVYVCRNLDKEVVGGFYIKPNFSLSCDHIANAAYMVKDSCRGQGIGSLLVKKSLELAKNSGFQAMQFNMVLSQNMIAIRLYEKLLFKIIGVIPQAFRNQDGSYQDGYIFYRKLNN